MIQASAKLKNIRMSAKKVNLVASAIRGLDVITAQKRLAVIFKKSSQVMDKLLKSAIANAKNKFEVKEEDLVIKEIRVNQGLALKRWRPAAFGAAHPFKKHSAHIEIILGVKEGAKATAKKEEKKEIETVDLTGKDKGAQPKGEDITKGKGSASQSNAGSIQGDQVRQTKTQDPGNVKKG